MKNIDLVIARYKEDINWLSIISEQNFNLINNIYLYEKFPNLKTKFSSILLPNLGRESNTYLHHIIENYNNLNDYTMFLQGDPFPHIGAPTISNLQKKIQETSISNSPIIPLNKVIIEDNNTKWRHHRPHINGLHLSYFMDVFFDITLDHKESIDVSYGAQFSVSKDAILSRPIDFYKYLLRIVSRKTNGIEPYIFERLWLYIFNPNIKISDSYKAWICSE